MSNFTKPMPKAIPAYVARCAKRPDSQRGIFASPDRMRAEAKERAARIRATSGHIGTQPASIPEISRAPKPSKKGSCTRKRNGEPSSAKVVKANAMRTLNAARAEAKAAIRKAKAESHAQYVADLEAKAEALAAFRAGTELDRDLDVLPVHDVITLDSNEG